MKKEEFLQKCHDLRWTQSELEEDIDSVIASEIAEHELRQWHTDHNEVPNKQGYYLVVIETHKRVTDCVAWNNTAKKWQSSQNIIAWRELPTFKSE